MAPIVTHSKRPGVRSRSAGALVAQLERWGAPVSDEHAGLLPRFLASQRAELARLLQPIYLAVAIFYLLFVITDVLLYTSATLALLGLRTVLVGNYLVGWRVLRRWRQSWPIYRVFGISTMIAMVVICMMLAAIGMPAEFYVQPLLVLIPLLAMLPMPQIWYLAIASSVVAIYATTMAAAGMLLEREAIEIAVGLGLSVVIFGVIHAYTERQRWQSFLNHTRSEELGARLQSELALARRIQRGLLQPGAPGWPGLDLVCWSEAAREVGGDFYAYLCTADGRLSLAVGDVSGKGLPAALMMGTGLAYLRAAAEDAESPARLLTHLDQALADTTRATRQNCAICCVELAGGRLRVANAGGVMPLIRRADGRVAWVEVGGLPLGTALGGLGYRDVTAELGPGDLLALVSDGAVEAMSEAGELFGFERLEAAVAACDAATANVFVAELREALAAFMGIAEAHDDMTIVALRMA